MRSDTAVFILSHGRADKVQTLKALKKHGYTGKIYLLLDNEDNQEEQYKKLGTDGVIVFDKEKYIQTVDTLDNFGEHGAVVYARNALFDIAADMGLTYFVALDDDYTTFLFRYKDHFRKKLMSKKVSSLDDVIEAYIDFLELSGAKAISMAQGGDYIGGYENQTIDKKFLRKAMNFWVCKTDRRINFVGTTNEDTNSYVLYSSQGDLFFTDITVCLVQARTQRNSGGLTEIYLKQGTYVKSFYSVIVMPSAVKVSAMGGRDYRIHHEVDWNKCAPLILSDNYKQK